MVVRGKGGVFPFVRARVAGHPVTLLLDTGAVRSILPRAFARAHNLATASRARDEYTVDANGNMVQMSVLPNVPVQFEGEAEVGKLDFLLNPSAAGTTQGILAPQDVVRSGWALVIDFRHETLKHEPEELALEHVRAESPQLRELDVSGCLSQGLFDRHHRIVLATINGVETKMLVDTGASTTAVARNNPALASMIKMQGNRETTVMVTSKGQTLVVDHVPVVVAGTSFVLPIQVVPTSQTCGQGALGADLLRHCTLVWGSKSLWAACRQPLAASPG
jgi:gag-polyprotein putative aspartyl protease/Aspartyl protease